MTPLRILVVDDHAVVRRGVRALLESQPDWEVCGEASDGLDAIHKTALLQPDIALLDISLPGINGLEAIPRILEESPGTKVLVLTMHHSEELAQQAMKAGARGYVLKSDADQSLIAAVDSARRHHGFLTTLVADGGHTPMTVRELQILRMVADAQTSKQIGSQLGISVKTVEAHRTRIMRKLGVRSVSELVRYAVRNGLIQP